MSAQATTKLQVNYKLADGTLINVYADNQEDLQTQLSGLTATAETIAATASALGMSRAVAAISATLGATPVVSSTTATPTASYALDECKHGKRQWREGVGPRGPWKAWMCPSPKGTLDQCRPNFDKK